MQKIRSKIQDNCWATVKLFCTFMLLSLLILPQKVNAENSAERWYRLAKEYLNEKSNYSKALEAYNRFFDIAEKDSIRYAKKIAIASMGAGYIYMAYGDYVNALACYQKSYRYSLDNHDHVQAQRNLNNVAQCYIKLERYSEALASAKEISRMKNIPIGERDFDYYDILAQLAERSNKEAEAEVYWRAAIKTVERYGMETSLKIEPLQHIGMHFEDKGRLDSALIYYQEAYKQAKVQGQNFPILGCTRDLMRIYIKLGDKKNSLRFQNLYFHLSDSLMSADDFLKIQSIRTQNYKTRTAKEMEDMTLTITRQKAVMIILMVVALVVLIIIFLLWIQKRRLDVTYHALFERNKELLDMEAKYNAMQATKEDSGQCSTPIAPSIRDDKQLLERIQEVLTDMNEICNPDFNLNRLTSLVGTNTSYVSQIINSEYGKNFRTLINELRIHEAQRRIVDTEKYGHLTIQAIGESVGFSSQTTFNRTFKRITGITPSVYQKMAKEEA